MVFGNTRRCVCAVCVVVYDLLFGLMVDFVCFIDSLLDVVLGAVLVVPGITKPICHCVGGTLKPLIPFGRFKSRCRCFVHQNNNYNL